MEMFTCPRHTGDLTITPAACAQMYRRGKRAEPWDWLAPCRGCRIGAEHAGEVVVPEPSARECLRCGRQARRLIGKRLCLSCYNREREIITGHYRRKSPPGGLRLIPVSILLSGQSDPVRITVASTVEALLWAARQFPGRGILAVSPAIADPMVESCLPMAMAVDEPVTWRLTDHVCRICFGRVLERRDADGRCIVRCANCGIEVAGRVENLCCCGLKTSIGRWAGLKCVKNESPTPEQPAEVMVRFTGI